MDFGRSRFSSFSRGHHDLSRPQNHTEDLYSSAYVSTEPSFTNEPNVPGYQSPYAFDNQRTYETQPSNIGIKRSIEELHDDGLDSYDRSLLEESSRPSRQHVPVGISPSFSGRLSLPRPTAFAGSASLWAAEFDQADNRDIREYRPHGGQSELACKTHLSGHYLQLTPSGATYSYNPPDRNRKSSPTTGSLGSSPMARINERRITHTGSQAKPRFKAKSKLFSRSRKMRTSSASLRDLDSDRPALLGTSQQSPSISIEENTAAPVVQGIRLISPHELPDRFRSIFGFAFFNAIQSKCFPCAFQSNDNLVVSAPTGGGKTVILELSICRVFNGGTDSKVIYMAPTKSLCSERQRDWQAKFGAIGIQCAELTGDTDNFHLREARSAHIIITTPEKWDSMTRKWRDHAKLMRLVRLILVDEVHMVKDTRGATLEAVVSRMKSIGAVRFVALSATVPNSEDIASWLGRSSEQAENPAVREVFGEEFRPVKLQKYVLGVPYSGNDFGFEKACDPVLPSIIAKYSQQKPIIIFCSTRKSTVATAKSLCIWWSTTRTFWNKPKRMLRFDDEELGETVKSGVAFHHAGLDAADRSSIEQGFLEGDISVICCTSTLAMGVNLPCHFVIIKNTMGFQDNGLKEYSDLEIIQMLGRAGRPQFQFDTSAIAVIITKEDKISRYEKLMSGSEMLESALHFNLIEHLNAEVSLGTIRDLASARKWLSGTFLYVRLQKNPGHYKVEGDSGESLDQRVNSVCQRDLSLLEEAEMIVSQEDGNILATRYGEIMAGYYVSFETMKLIIGLPRQATMSELVSLEFFAHWRKRFLTIKKLSAIVQANEYRDIRFKSYEKRLFKYINRHNCIKFPIKVELSQHAHKRTLIVQAELGCVDYPADEDFKKMRLNYMQEKGRIFSSVHRLVRCAIDCQIEAKDAVGIRNSLELARSLGARVWDNSPFQMKQLPQIGPIAVRKLVNGGISTLEALEATEPHRIETLLRKSSPFGNIIIKNAAAFPKLRVSIKMIGKDIRPSESPIIKFKVEWGSMNEKPVSTFQRKPIQICLVTERSDGLLIDYSQMSAALAIKNPHQNLVINAQMTEAGQFFTCSVMCNEIAGTLRYAQLRPEIPPSCFPPLRGPVIQPKRNSKSLKTPTSDEFGDADIDDTDFLDAVAPGNDFTLIDDIETKVVDNKKDNQPVPEKLPNGRWACKHTCKDKNTCKHTCCRDGLERMPRPSKQSAGATKAIQTKASLSKTGLEQAKIHVAHDTGNGFDDRVRPASEVVGDLGRGGGADQLNDPEMQDLFGDVDLDNLDDEESSTLSPKLPRAPDSDRADDSDGWLNDFPSLPEMDPYEPALTRTDHSADGQLHDEFKNPPGILETRRMPQVGRQHPEKLFMSTDSPEKPTTAAPKRPSAIEPSTVESSRGLEDPRAEQENLALEKSPGESEEKVLNAGLPAWAHEFGDPDFIAEWNDYVDLV